MLKIFFKFIHIIQMYINKKVIYYVNCIASSATEFCFTVKLL